MPTVRLSWRCAVRGAPEGDEEQRQRAHHPRPEVRQRRKRLLRPCPIDLVANGPGQHEQESGQHQDAQVTGSLVADPGERQRATDHAYPPWVRVGMPLADGRDGLVAAQCAGDGRCPPPAPGTTTRTRIAAISATQLYSAGTSKGSGACSAESRSASDADDASRAISSSSA